MTDKQIIIDGIDVSECDRLNAFPMQYGEPQEICLTSFEQWGGQEKYCKDRPNCYYKQLIRKEQKLEKIKETVKYYAELKCEDCKYLSVSCVDCNEVIAQEVIQIIEDKNNG